ncbi:lytic transglycosylase domain-containing protein [Lysinibacillus halotolerans]|uniref:Lytic transglycosylase domain-containing protein n=1 Tax=Lysinibacillus halotolerans TaxID=1368476 RepID=A0A3M8HH60_9BACI|nr:lytic transglycosylase domain-containing protein [Lysinibacillus halotolerans]RND01421.1 lytic transglycosylase domain-containing protein [Lysinibacillus halotolerans]
MANKTFKKKPKKPLISPAKKLFLIVLLIPVSVTVYFCVFLVWDNIKNFSSLHHEEKINIQEHFDIEIPEEYIPIYISAGEAYGVPWTLLAAHHRVETKFSTMKELISPAGAEGHMQFMPCTFVGWNHPTCSGLGEGEIPAVEKTNPEMIEKYGGFGVDANGDGIADPYDIEDAIYSAANYLSKSGASDGELRKAIFNYNHSEEYVEDILYYYHLYEEVGEELVQLSRKN